MRIVPHTPSVHSYVLPVIPMCPPGPSAHQSFSVQTSVDVGMATKMEQYVQFYQNKEFRYCICNYFFKLN